MPLCGKAFLDLRRFGFLVGPFGRFTQCYKTRSVIRRDIGQDFAVQFNACLFQAADELVVADALSAGSGADTHDPDRAVLAFLLLAARIGEFESALYRFFCGALEF